MRKNLKLIQAMVEQPAELDRAISSDESADKLSLADTLIKLVRSSSEDLFVQARAERRALRLRRGS